MVQRLTEGDEGIYPDENGTLVEYEDYLALELKLLAVHSHLEHALRASQLTTKGYIKIALRMLDEESTK